MTQRYIHMNVADVPPTVHDLDCMTLCIHFWRKKRTFEAWKHTSQLYEQLLLSLQQQDTAVRETWYNRGHIPAMTTLLNVVLIQWQNIRLRGIQKHLESESSTPHQTSIIHGPTPSQMLDQLWTWKSMEPMLLLNPHSFALVIQVAAGGINDYCAEETPCLCESIFRRMLQTQSSLLDRRTLPNARLYTLVLRAWAKCDGNPEATEHLWNLFNDIQQLHKDGILEDPLNRDSYALVIERFMGTQKVDWMNRADQLFQQMQESSTLTPDKEGYATYLTGWLTYEDLTLEQWHHCKAVLDDAMKRSKGSPEDPLADFSIFLRFMAKASKLGRDDLAEQIYVELGQWNKQFSSLIPETYRLKDLLKIYTRKLQPELAEQSLFIFIRESRRERNHDQRPKALHFGVVIKCWLKQTASKEDGLERAGQLLLRAVELDDALRLNLSDEPLHWILSAWAQSGRDDAPARAAALLVAFQARSKKGVRKASFQLVKNMQRILPLYNMSRPQGGMN
jgi:hypothetical protein